MPPPPCPLEIKTEKEQRRKGRGSEKRGNEDIKRESLADKLVSRLSENFSDMPNPCQRFLDLLQIHLCKSMNMLKYLKAESDW